MRKLPVFASHPCVRTALKSRIRRWCRTACVLSSCCVGAAQAEEGSESIWRSLEFGGSVELAYERQQNFDLDRDSGDDVDLLPLELQLEVLFAPSAYFEAYLQTQLTEPFVLREEGADEDRDTEFVVEEAYFTLSDPDRGLSLQVGRQSFEDLRQWLYDVELDAVRVARRSGDFSVELSASRKALVTEDLLNAVDEEPVNNYILYSAYELDEEVTLGGYVVFSDHRNGDRDRPVFLGLYSAGTIAGRLDFWLDVAQVRGREAGQSLRGYGGDLLGVYRFDAPLSPHLILGYAFGSGDSDPDDGRDDAFRQTGFQENETEVGGLTPFRYYGEAFDPELSNMSIFTAGLGARPLPGLSLDLVYHYYLQDEASDELRDSALDLEPTGESRRLGSEIDLVVGFEPLEDLHVRGFLGYFMPGRAFASGTDDALFARLEVLYEF